MLSSHRPDLLGVVARLIGSFSKAALWFLPPRSCKLLTGENHVRDSSGPIYVQPQHFRTPPAY
eukprot:1446731-Amphidinium_carterae.1